MNLLAIETSTLTGSVALLRDEAVVGEITLSVSVQHSERLMPAIDQLLRDAGTKPADIDLYAVATGPGSFTGLRIGIAAAQGLALARGKPVVGVSTLEALALNGIFFPGLIVPLLDAFRGEVYRGLYRRTAEGLGAIGDDRAVGLAPLIDELRKQDGAALLLGNGVELYGKKIEEELGIEKISIAPPPLRNPRASNVAFLALQKWKSGEKEGSILPRYLRKPG
jgi:tRNA threonylcarbamoyladenosine biosynthesis protein TsaB